VLMGPGYPTPVIPATSMAEDRFARLKRWADELALGRNNTRRGFIRTTV
jgi:hypothetical protein